MNSGSGEPLAMAAARRNPGLWAEALAAAGIMLIVIRAALNIA
jgi:hypothetical protein